MKRTNFHNLVVIIAAVICVVFVFDLARGLFHDRSLERLISSELAAVRISNKDLVGKLKHLCPEKRYWVPDSFSPADFGIKLKKSLDRSGFKLLSTAKSIKKSAVKGKSEWREEVSFLIAERSSEIPIFRLTLIRGTALKSAQAPVPVPKAPPAPEAKPVPAPVGAPEAKPVTSRPRLAIVLDDWGYNTKNLEAVLGVDKPITLSILPGLPYSTLIARKARDRGFEVILHMPMEPKAKIKLEPATLRSDMSEDEIRSNLSRAFQTVPNAKGLNNHEGSKATEDRNLMRTVFGELKKNNMFFLDSLVTNYSVCESVAKETGVRFVKRSIFLDNESDSDYIKKQFGRAVDIALKSGAAVAIGHDRTNTIAVLKEMIPAIEDGGIEIVSVSDLAGRR